MHEDKALYISSVLNRIVCSVAGSVTNKAGNSPRRAFHVSFKTLLHESQTFGPRRHYERPARITWISIYLPINNICFAHLWHFI